MAEGYCKLDMKLNQPNIVITPRVSEPQESLAIGGYVVKPGSNGAGLLSSSPDDSNKPGEGVPSTAPESAKKTTAEKTVLVGMQAQNSESHPKMLLADILTASNNVNDGSSFTIIQALKNLKAIVKKQNNIINKLSSELDTLGQLCSLTRSDKVREGISNLIATTEELATSRTTQHPALNIALRATQS